MTAVLCLPKRHSLPEYLAVLCEQAASHTAHRIHSFHIILTSQLILSHSHHKIYCCRYQNSPSQTISFINPNAFYSFLFVYICALSFSTPSLIVFACFTFFYVLSFLTKLLFYLVYCIHHFLNVPPISDSNTTEIKVILVSSLYDLSIFHFTSTFFEANIDFKKMLSKIISSSHNYSIER